MRFTCSYVSSIKKFFESGILVSGMSWVWEDTNGFTKQYRCDLSIYVMNFLSSSYGIITDRATNTPSHGNIVVYVINTTDTLYLKE